MENLKAKKMSLVAQKTLLLCERGGVDSITISHVAKLAKVSRPWIYKYIGGTKSSLISFALDQFGKEFALLENRPNPQNPQTWLISLTSGFDHLLDICRKNPWALSIYFRFKGADGLIGEKVRQIEVQFIDKSAEEIQKALSFSKAEALDAARFLTTVRMALVHDILARGDSKELRQKAKLQVVELCEKMYLEK